MTDAVPPGGQNPVQPGGQNPTQPGGQNPAQQGGRDPEPPGGPYGQPGYGQPGYQPYGQPGPAPYPPGYGQPSYQPYGQPGYGQPGYQPYGQPGMAPYPPGYGQPGMAPYPPPGYGGWNAAPAPGGVPLRPLSLGDIWSGAVTLARRNPAATFGLTAIVVTVYAVALALLHRWVGNPATTPVFEPGQQPTQTSLGAAQVTVLLATFALEFVSFAILTGLLSVVIGLGMLGSRVTMPEAWRQGRPAVVLGTSVSLLLLGIIPPVVIGLGVAGLVAAHATAAAALIGVLGGIGTIGYVALVVIRLSLTLPALVLERVNPVAAIRRSWQLTRGSFWRLLGILLLTGVVVFLAELVLSIPFDVIEAVVAGSDTTSVSALAVTAAGTIIAATIALPLSAGVNVLLYADLRMRREGLDLALHEAAQNQTLTGDEFGALWQRKAAPAR